MPWVCVEIFLELGGFKFQDEELYNFVSTFLGANDHISPPVWQPFKTMIFPTSRLVGYGRTVPLREYIGYMSDDFCRGDVSRRDFFGLIWVANIPPGGWG